MLAGRVARRWRKSAARGRCCGGAGQPIAFEKCRSSRSGNNQDGRTSLAEPETAIRPDRGGGAGARRGRAGRVGAGEDQDRLPAGRDGPLLPGDADRRGEGRRRPRRRGRDADPADLGRRGADPDPRRADRARRSRLHHHRTGREGPDGRPAAGRGRRRASRSSPSTPSSATATTRTARSPSRSATSARTTSRAGASPPAASPRRSAARARSTSTPPTPTSAPSRAASRASPR